MFATLRDRRLLVPTVMTLAALPLLVGLGLWQLERRAWKEGLIVKIAARAKAAPISLAEASDHYRGTGETEYVRVVARGRYLNDKERYFFAPDAQLGPGYHVYTPFEIAGDGAVVFVNRGFVPESLKDPTLRPAGQFLGEVEVTGLLRAPSTQGLFDPDNDPVRNLWYWRDFQGLFASAFHNTQRPYIPVFLEAEAANVPGGWPKGGVTRLELPNRHLEYAITWFGLAAALVAVYAVFASQRFKMPPKAGS